MGTISITGTEPERHQHPCDATVTDSFDPAWFDEDRFTAFVTSSLSKRWHADVERQPDAVIVTFHLVVRGGWPNDFSQLTKIGIHIDEVQRKQLCGCSSASTANCPLTKAEADALMTAHLQELRLGR